MLSRIDNQFVSIQLLSLGDTITISQKPRKYNAKGEKTMDDARIEIRMSTEMKAKLQALAKSGSMTVGGYIKSLIQREIEKSKGTA